MTIDPPSSEPSRRRPLVVGIVGPPQDTSLLAVGLTTTLRGRGYRVGGSESRTTIEGHVVTVLTLGSGARVTLEGDLPPEALEERAASLDPTLDVLLALDRRTGHIIELLENEATAPTTEASRLLAAIPAARLAQAFAESGPAADLGLAEVIATRLARTATNEAERTLERPIETSRRRLPASPLEGAPQPARARTRRRSLLDRLRGKPDTSPRD